MIISSYTGEKIESPRPKVYAIPREVWNSLRPGDFVVSKGGALRMCLEGTRDGIVVLQKIRGSRYTSETTTYIPVDRGMFAGIKLAQKRLSTFIHLTGKRTGYTM